MKTQLNLLFPLGPEAVLTHCGQQPVAGVQLGLQTAQQLQGQLYPAPQLLTAG